MTDSDFADLPDETFGAEGDPAYGAPRLPLEMPPDLPAGLPPLEATEAPPPQPDVAPDPQVIYRAAARRAGRPLAPAPEGRVIPRDAQGRPDPNHPAAGQIVIPVGSQMPDPVQPLREIPEAALPQPPPPAAPPPPRPPAPPNPGPAASPPRDNGAPRGNPIDGFMARKLQACFAQGIPTYTTRAPAPAGIQGTVFGAMHKTGSLRIEIEYDNLQAQIFRYKVKVYRLDNKNSHAHEEYFRVHETPLVQGIVQALCNTWQKPRLVNPHRNPQKFGPGDAEGHLDDAARSSMYKEHGGFPQPGQPAVRPITAEEAGGFAHGGAAGPEGFGTGGEEFWEGGS